MTARRTRSAPSWADSILGSPRRPRPAALRHRPAVDPASAGPDPITVLVSVDTVMTNWAPAALACRAWSYAKSTSCTGAALVSLVPVRPRLSLTQIASRSIPASGASRCAMAPGPWRCAAAEFPPTVRSRASRAPTRMRFCCVLPLAWRASWSPRPRFSARSRQPGASSGARLAAGAPAVGLGAAAVPGCQGGARAASVESGQRLVRLAGPPPAGR
jgi:hypothetical protein